MQEQLSLKIDLNREYERIDDLYEKQKNKINEKSQKYINDIEKLENELENYDPFYKNVSKEFLDFWNNDLWIKHDLQREFDDDYKTNNLKESIDFYCDLSDDDYDKFIDFYTKDDELKKEFKEKLVHLVSKNEMEEIDFSKPDFEFVEMFINDKAADEYYSTFDRRCEVENLLQEKQIYENVNKYEFFINTFIDMVNECDVSNSLSFKVEHAEYIQPDFFENVVKYPKTGTWGYRSLIPSWEKELYIQPEIKVFDKKLDDVFEDEIYASKHNQYQNLKVSKNLTFDDNLCFGLLKDLQNQTEDFLKKYERHQTKQQELAQDYKIFKDDNGEKVCEITNDKIKELNVSGKDITKIIGLEKCKDLKEFSCYSNYLQELDLSNNINLQELRCYNNKLTTLDISQNENLKELWCWRNNLTSLDLSNNPNLKYLWCDDNELTTLDLSNNKNLQKLDCGYNNLTSLDVSKCENLQYLNCNYNKISTLDISNNPNLQWLNYDEYATKLIKDKEQEQEQEMTL